MSPFKMTKKKRSTKEMFDEEEINYEEIGLSLRDALKPNWTKEKDIDKVISILRVLPTYGTSARGLDSQIWNSPTGREAFVRAVTYSKQFSNWRFVQWKAFAAALQRLERKGHWLSIRDDPKKDREGYLNWGFRMSPDHLLHLAVETDDSGNKFIPVDVVGGYGTLRRKAGRGALKGLSRKTKAKDARGKLQEAVTFSFFVRDGFKETVKELQAKGHLNWFEDKELMRLGEELENAWCRVCFNIANWECARCNDNIYYCGRNCQREHWSSIHSKVCGKI